MAPSQVSGKKMKTLLFGVILGIFAVVHSVTSNVMLQNEVYLEAVTEGYLIEKLDILELSKRPEITEAPQQPSSESEKSDMLEGSGDAFDKPIKILFPQHGSDHHESTTQSAEHNHSSQHPSTESKESDTSEESRDASDKFLMTLFPQLGESTTQGGSHSQRPHTETTESMIEGSGEFTNFLQDGGEHITTTQSSTSTETTESMIEGSGEFTISLQDGGEHITTTQSSTSTETTESMIEGSGEFTISLQDGGEHITTTQSSTSIVPVIENEASGFGDIEFADEGKMSPVSTTQTPSLTRNIAPRLMAESNVSEPDVPETRDPQTHKDTAASPQSANQSTPGWIIIVAFIVGVAALVMLCVAIATRDKWNGPNQASKLETKTNSSNQQRELEMETFLQKDQPRENGEAAEFTVIQLDDLPDQYSSQ